jgi:hypothetical protein
MQEKVDEYVKYGSCFCRIYFVWHTLTSWKKLQPFVNTRWKRRLVILFKCSFGDAKVWTILPNNIIGFAIQK